MEQEFLELFEYAHSGVIIFDPERELILSVNKPAAQIYGYSRAEMPGMLLSVLLPDSADKKKYEEHIYINSNGGTESVHIHKDGTPLIIEVNTVPISFKGAQAIASINRDITNRKISEESLKISESRYRALVEQQTEMITRWLPDGRFTYVNDVFCRFFQKPREYFLGKNFIPKMPQDDIKKFDIFFPTLTKENPTGDFTHRAIMPNGENKWLKWTDTVILNDEDEIVEYQSVGRDITDRKIAEDRLRESEERYKRLVENINVINWEFDANEKIFLYVSPHAEKILGYPISDWSQPGFWIKHVHHDDREWVRDFINEKSGNPDDYELEYRFMASDGSYRWFRDITSTNHENNVLKSLYGIFIDITTQKKAEHKLRQTELRLTAHINTLPNIVFYESGHKKFLTENVFDLLGYSADYIMADYQRFEDLIHPDDKKIIEKAQNEWMGGKTNNIFTCEFRAKHKSGKEIWLEDHMFRIELDDGKEYHSGVLIDITERKKVEEKIRDSLNEKELLIKEIHHRVKNNLQVVSSLLKLQSGYVKDDEARGLLLESQNRVQSMALVHQKLYQSHDLSKIDFQEYIQQLLFHLFIVFKVRTGDIKLTVKAESLKIGVDTAVPCGLIINELVSNSLKHAFNPLKDSTIDIELSAIDEKNYMLIVADNGKGFPGNVDFRHTTSLGMQLVITLVNQLDGTIEMENNNGTKFTITFSNIDYKERL